MNDSDLQRAFDLITKADMSGSRTEESPYGVAVFEDELPLRFDSNHLLVGELDTSVTADNVMAEAKRLRRPAVFLRDERTARRLAPAFEAHGWENHGGLVMAHRGPIPSPGVSEVVEVDESALRPARRRRYAAEPWANPDVIEQSLDWKRRIAERVKTCFFAVFDGDDVVSYCDLYLGSDTAQIEDVATLIEHRRRGHASSVVTHALRTAKGRGCNLVFLVTDIDGCARHMYQRLGFEAIGQYTKFVMH